jgi:DNA-binding LacI/PurR family transcriptional regulator
MDKPAHPPRVTISDVAQRARVSIATVSRVLNQTAVVSQATRERVQSVIAELNYIPHGAARSLASGKTGALGLLVPEISSNFATPLLRGIEAAARLHGYDLVIFATERQLHPQPGILRPVGEHNTDGLLIFAGSLEMVELERLYRLHFPVVLLHQTPRPGLQIPSVTFENKSGSRRMVAHLIEVHGYRRIAFLRGPKDHEDSYWRELGYREALQLRGIEFDPELIGQGNFDPVDTERVVRGWLGKKLVMDAIFAGDDDSAIGALQALQMAGLKVPEQIAVVGFDDVPFSQFTTPPLTTVHAPIEQAGYEAVAQLVQLIQTGRAEPTVLLPTELVIRRSCGCSPGV